jgi:hypothetical protein
MLTSLRKLAFASALIVVTGCASHHEPPATPTAGATPPSDASSGAEAKVHINYSRPGDFLSSLIVTKYSGAETLKTVATRDGAATIVRLDGGIVVWQFAVEKSMLTGVPLIGPAEQRYSPTEVKYGDLPDHFVESMPDFGPPEPLEPQHYYVFAATRGSGSVSYEAVKVNGDGSLEAYEADPRAGSSFWLCCNVADDFTISAPAPAPAARP